MSNLDIEINESHRKVKEIMESGYTRQEAILLIQAAAMSKLSNCIRSDYNGKDYLRISGQVSTYEQ